MSTDRVARIEGIVQVLILLFMGVMAGAASFVHIHDVTVTHGQPSWIGWANAVVVELMSIVAGLDIRRRNRSGQSTGFVLVVLLTAVGVSLAAQVAQAHPSVWGWTVAALPALGLLAVVKIVLSRTTTTATPDHTTTASGTAGPPDRTDHGETTGHGQTALGRSHTLTAPSNRIAARPLQTDQPDPTAQPAQPASDPDRTGHRMTTAVRSATGPPPGQRQVRTEDSGPGPTLGRTRTTAPHGLDDLLDPGRAIAANLHRQQRPLTRATLTAGIRATGHTISTDNATALLRQLKTTNRNTTADTRP
jgi:Protein of unknown function (DUF2637)